MLWLGMRAEKAGPDRLIGVVFDITDRKNAEEELWRVANHDALTGLANRALFQHRLDRALTEATQNGNRVSLLLIDLDHFKDVNDALGHDAGDALLKKTAAHLQGMVQDCDTVARFGGDEFAIVLAGALTLDCASEMARSITEKLREPFVYAGQTFVSSASIGVAIFPDHDSSAGDLLKDADIALYRAKAQGRNCAVIYTSNLRAAVEQRISLRHEVREALSSGHIVPFYQPKVCLSTGKIIGFEALARWQHPSRGVLTPAYFGAILDDPEPATELGRQLMSRVASDMRVWLKAGLDLGRVAVNLSSAEFIQPGLADYILRLLEESSVPTQNFEVEVTETVLVGRRSDVVASTLKRLHQQGILIALDDFGTGYASLTHLKQFPVDHVKIDRSFVTNLEQDTGDEAIVAAVIGLGRSLNLQVTAEGVETEGQAQRLRALGCHNAQGYHYAKPMAASQVPQFLSRRQAGSNQRGNIHLVDTRG
jgi:diguanylate cyclase (GGDEF)-like protein